MSAQHPHDKVALTVVRFLGAAAITFGVGAIFLVWAATQYEGIDPSTIALVSGVTGMAGVALGSLASVLASTGKGAPQPVTVENPPSDPAAVSVVPPQPPAPPTDLDGEETPL